MPKRTLKVNYKIWEAMNKPQPIIVIIGGRGCVSPDTMIDTPSGQVRIDCFDGGLVYALTEFGIAPVYAEKPIKYPKEQLYKVTLSDGSSLTCTDQHRFLTEDGWLPLFDVLGSRLPICVSSRPLTSLGIDPLESGEDVQHCFRTLLGFLYSYFWYCHQCGLPPHEAPKTYLDVVRLLGDERQHKTHALKHADAQEFWSTRSPSQLLRLLSNLDALLCAEVRSYEGQENYNTGILSELILLIRQESLQFHLSNDPQQLVQRFCGFFQGFCISEKYQAQSLQTISDMLRLCVDDATYSDSLSCNHDTHYTTIDSCVESSVSEYFDLFVPLYNNYLSNGIINHNSGKSLGVGDIAAFEMDAKGYDWYCLREFQDSLSDSVHRVFVGAIEDRLQLENWDIQQSTVIAPNGARTTYKGANRNPDAMQSAQGYLRSWFEEAHRASQASLDKLLPTILRNPGAKCIFTANPQSSGDPFSQRFIVPYLKELEAHGEYEDALHYIVVVNWRDNPWWNEEQEALRAWDYANLPRAKYDWIWEGKFMDTVENAIILPEWFDACVDAHEKLGFKATGRKVLAHDPSDLGHDDKGLCFRHGSVVLDVQARSYGDVADGCDWATSYAIQKGAQDFIWDGDGLGLGLRRQVADNLKGQPIKQTLFRGSEGPNNPDALYQRIDDNSAQPVKNKDAFKNKRSQYYIALRDRMYRTYRAVVHGEYNDPDEMLSFSSQIDDLQSLRSEICRVPEKKNGNGKIQIMSKEDMAKLEIDSPNKADSVMMSLFIPDKLAAIDTYMPSPIQPMGHRRGFRANQRTR